MIRSVTPETLGRFKWGIGVGGMNWDRDPGDVDFVEVNVSAAVGLPAGFEAHFRFSPTIRTNSVNQDPLRFPPPPVDMVVDVFPTVADRSEPWLMFTQEAPYKTYFLPGVGVRVPTRGAHGRSTGDVIVGLKKNFMMDGQNGPFSFGVMGYAELPTETPGYNTPSWRDKAGLSGEKDFGLEFLFGKNLHKGQLIWSVGYKKIGDPDRAYTIQFVDSGAESIEDFSLGPPVSVPLDLKDEIRLNAGFTYPAFTLIKHQVWFMAELLHIRYAGSGTPVQKVVNPIDLILGLQFNPDFAKWLSIGGAWLMYLNAAGHGGFRDSPFQDPSGKGDVNFSEMVDPDLSAEVRAYLESRGVVFSENSNKIFSTNNPAYDAWRNVPTDPGQVISRGGGAGILFITIRP